jgi:hypothetical protein
MKTKRWRVTIGYVGEQMYAVRAPTERAARAEARRRFESAKGRRQVAIECMLAREIPSSA